LLSGELDLALDRLDRSLKETNELTEAHPDYSEWQLDLALCHLRLGEFYLKRNAKIKVTEHLRQSLPILERLAAESPDNVKRQRDLDLVRSILLQTAA